MVKLSSRVLIVKEFEPIYNGMLYRAYWRGTNNRVCYQDGLYVQARTKKADLLWDLRNNRMENGVIVK